MRDLETMKLREMQTLAARALHAMEATNNNIYRFNKEAHHNSHNWYRAVIAWYIEEYNGWPDEVGPGTQAKLISEE